jgi:ankyrin repeat protein
MAAEMGRADIVGLILESISDEVSDSSMVYAEILTIACTKGFYDLAVYVVDVYEDMAGGDSLMKACEHGHVDIIQELLDRSAAWNLDTSYSSNSFLVALLRTWCRDDNKLSDNNKNTILDMLLDHDEPLEPDFDCMELWRCAGQGGTVAFVARLLRGLEAAGGADSDTDAYVAEALHGACEYGRRRSIEHWYAYLQRKGAGRYISPSTLLGEATRGENEAAFHMVLSLLNINVDAQGEYDDPDLVLFHAAACGCQDMVATLLAGGRCDVNKAQDAFLSFKAPATVLAAASAPAVAEALLAYKADVNPRGCLSVLTAAVYRGQEATVKLLLQAGADARVQSSASLLNRSTLMEVAVAATQRRSWKTNISIINLLMDAGVQTRGLDGGATALTRCVTNMDDRLFREEFVQALLSREPGLLDAPDSSGRTPLMLAAAPLKQFVYQFLLKSANLLACDNEGWTALTLLLEARAHPYFVDEFLSSMRKRYPLIGGVPNDGQQRLRKRQRK